MSDDESREALRLFKRALASDLRFHIGPSSLNDTEAVSANKSRKQKAKAKKAEEEADRIHRENELRSLVGKASLVIVSVQLIVFDVIMGIYILVTLFTDGSVPSEIILGWMSACLVEIIGILWVIARSLFPFRDKRRDSSSEKGK